MLFSITSTCLEARIGEPLYSLQELQQLGMIDAKAAQWVKDHPLPEEDPLLVLDFIEHDCVDRSDEIRMGLINCGATLVSSNIFQFNMEDEIADARLRMMDTHLWAFYHTKPVLAQRLGVRATPTITATVITSNRNQPSASAAIPMPRENEVLIQRRKDNGGQTVPYRIIDNPSRLTDEEWDRVVAVFVQGPAWQFKGWHWGGNPTTIFSHVCGFHLKFEDAKLDANVAKWSVDVLSLSKQKRHLDKAIFIRLWQKIEQFIIRNKPGLRY